MLNVLSFQGLDMHLSCYWRYLSRVQMTTSSSLSCLEPARPDCRGWVGLEAGMAIREIPVAFPIPNGIILNFTETIEVF